MSRIASDIWFAVRLLRKSPGLSLIIIGLLGFGIGTNAVLPTGGFAHTYSCTSVFDFLKRTGIAYVTAEGYPSLSKTTRTLADFEGFPAHANAVTNR